MLVKNCGEIMEFKKNRDKKRLIFHIYTDNLIAVEGSCKDILNLMSIRYNLFKKL